MKKNNLSFAFEILVTIIVAIVMAFGLTVFLSPNRFLSTGFTGLSLVIGRLYDNIFKPSSSKETFIAGFLLLLFNVPILIFAWKKLSHRYAILSTINVVVTSICISFMPDNLHEILHLSVEKGDITLLDAALFVGLINGCANAFAYIIGGSTGGIDILSTYYSIRKQSSIGKLTIILNGIILLLGFLVDGTDAALSKALYTLVYVLISSIVIDLFYVRNRRHVLLINTTKGKEIANVITHKYVRGVTMIDAKGAFTDSSRDVLYSVCLSFEVDTIIKEIYEIDPHAFITTFEANKVYGNFISKEIR